MKILNALPKSLLLILFSVTLYLLPASASAQICAGSNLRYVVRNELGKVIDPTGVYETKAKSGSPKLFSIEIDELQDAQKIVKGITGNSARVIHATGMCNFREPVRVTLKLKGKEMNLTFLMPRFSEYESRSFVVDSLPFQPGTFEIDLSAVREVNPAGDWSGSFFPARGWKKVKTAAH